MSSIRRILVADGDPDCRGRILDALASPAYELLAAADAHGALALARQEKPDLLVCELAFPDMSGLALCRLLREDAAQPGLGILAVTALATEMDRVLAFECGVDDFLAKPFFARELASRAGAVLRRALPGRPASGGAAGLPQPAVALHPNSVIVAGRRLDLTPREYQILAVLMREHGRVVTRGQLIGLVWGADSEQDERVVDAHVKAIRRKLGEAGASLETVRGVGYRYAELGAA